MKRIISICIIILILMVIAIVLINSQNTSNREVPAEPIQVTEKEETRPVVNNLGNKKYFLGVQSGQVIVYDVKTNNIVMTTDLHLEELPEHIIDKLAGKIYLENDQELYDFLETYSS